MTQKGDFVPPHNYEAEAAVLGSILIDKEALIKIADMLAPEDFYRESHHAVFDVMLSLYSKSEPIDILTVSTVLIQRGKLEMVGGRTQLASLAEAVPTSSHIANYAKTVRDCATLRRLIGASQEVTKLGFDQAEEAIEDILDRAEEKLFNVSQKYIKKHFATISSVLSDAFDRIDALHKEKGKLRGVPTGFRQLDNLLGGLQKSDLVILAARPAVGKTSLALDIARHVAVKTRLPVGIFSLEMSKEQLVDRMICAEADVDLWKLRTGKLSDQPGNDDFPRIGNAIGVLSDAPIFIDDSANMNIMEIRTKIRRLAKETKEIGLIIIDYLQLMESRTKVENRVQEISAITRSLKNIAREMNVPVLALSQLSRQTETQGGPAIPKLAHLRESGSIEQDADVVMFLYRKAADRHYKIEDIPPEERYIAEIHVAKHRNGPIGNLKVIFDEARAHFKDTETRPAAVTAPVART